MYPVGLRSVGCRIENGGVLLAAHPGAALRTVLLHHLQKLDHHLGGWPHKHLSLATLLCIIHRLERICEDRHAHHLAFRASMSAQRKCRRKMWVVDRLKRMTPGAAATALVFSGGKLWSSSHRFRPNSPQMPRSIFDTMCVVLVSV